MGYTRILQVSMHTEFFFQFPLWDTFRFLQKCFLQKFFQFPLWDTYLAEESNK